MDQRRKYLIKIESGGVGVGGGVLKNPTLLHGDAPFNKDRCTKV